MYISSNLVKKTRHQMPWEGGHPTSLVGEEDE